MNPDRAACPIPFGAGGALLFLSGRSGALPRAAVPGEAATAPTGARRIGLAASPDTAVLRLRGKAQLRGASPGANVGKELRVAFKGRISTETVEKAETALDFYDRASADDGVIDPQEGATLRVLLVATVGSATVTDWATARAARMLRRAVELPNDEAA
jgi:hypothetical protein